MIAPGSQGAEGPPGPDSQRTMLMVVTLLVLVLVLVMVTVPRSVTEGFQYSCPAADGTDLSDATGPLYCSVADPQLRRVTVTLTDLTGAVRSRLVTEVGRPCLRGSP